MDEVVSKVEERWVGSLDKEEPDISDQNDNREVATPLTIEACG